MTKPMEEEPSSLVLPLWQATVEEMQRSGVTHGSVYEAAWFEQRLAFLRGSFEFDWAISKIQAALERAGFCLNECGPDGDRFVILAPELNSDRMLDYQRRAIEILGRGVALGTNTRLSLLSESRRRRHEAILERIATRTALISRHLRVPYNFFQNG